MEKQRFLLPAWAIFYLGLLVMQASLTYFDPMDARLVFPSEVTLVLVFTVLVTAIIPIKTRYWVLPALAAALLALSSTTIDAIQINRQHSNFEDIIATSPRLAWVAANTTNRDLIFGDDTMDLPFYLERTATVSFSPNPYTDYPEYEQWMAFAGKHCSEYENMFLVIRNRYQTTEKWQNSFGPFITDLWKGQLEKYPAIQTVVNLKDALVFKINCK